MRRAHLLAALPALVLAHAAAAQSLSGRPLRTEDAETMAFGRHAFEVGAEAMTDVVPVPLLGDKAAGDIVRLPVFRYRMGLGRAELGVGGAAWQSFAPEGAGLDDEDEVGDFELWLKVGLLRDAPGRPAIGFAIDAKMPNASDETGLGTDETDLFAAFLLSKAWGAHELRLNLGLAILGDPLADSSQEDLLTYGFGGRHGARHAALWEVWGRGLDSDDERRLEESTARLGYGLFLPRFAFDVSLLIGLEEASGDVGLAVGATWLVGSPSARR